VALLALTLFALVLTLGNGRTNFPQGALHLARAAVFLRVSAVPRGTP
jgi:hypothetical protein